MHLVDSHCHLDFPDYDGRHEDVLRTMAESGVTHALCACVNLDDFPKVLRLAEVHANLYASVGVHPDQPPGAIASVAELVQLAQHPKVVAIGETGLDYYRLTGDLEWQRERFRAHIRAARECGKPLIVHTRAAADDTMRILQEECASQVGGVMHCFTESLATAQAALDLGFYISFSGIVTFKNAEALRAVVRQVPLNRLLVETDSPYLAPVPHRGKVNQPAWVRHVVNRISEIKSVSIQDIASSTSRNFFNLFRIPAQAK